MSAKAVSDLSEETFNLLQITEESSYAFRAAKKLLKKKTPDCDANIFQEEGMKALNDKIKQIIEGLLETHNVARGIFLKHNFNKENPVLDIFMCIIFLL